MIKMRLVFPTLVLAFVYTTSLAAVSTPNQSKDLIKPPDRILSVNCVVFSPDGKLIAAGAKVPGDKGEVVVWDSKTFKVRAVHYLEKGAFSLAFSPNSATLAVGNLTEHCYILDSATGNVKAKLSGHGESARSVAFSPDGTILAVGGYDGKIRLWDWRKEKLLRSWETDPKQRVFGLAFSPDGSVLTSWNYPRGDVTIWDPASGKPLRAWKDAADAMAFEKNGLWLAIGSSTALKLRDFRSDRELLTFGGSLSVHSLAAHPSGKALAVTRTFSHAVQIYPIELREATPAEQKRIAELIARWEDDSMDVREKASEEIVKFGLLAEHFLAKTMKDGISPEARMRARLARATVKSPKPAFELVGHRDQALCSAFSPDSQVLATGARDGQVILWDTVAYKSKATLQWPDQGP